MSKSKRLRRLYAELPTIQCKGECWPFCSQIQEGTSPEEWEGMLATRGQLPKTSSADLCHFLQDGRCSVYRVRPLICRLFGVVESMVCPWGCKPTPRYLTTFEMHEFLYRLRTGASKEEAARFISTVLPVHERVEWEQLADSGGALTWRAWTRTEREAMLKLWRQGRIEHIPEPARLALKLIDNSAILPK